MIRLSEVEPLRTNNFNLIRMVAAFGVLVSHAFPLSSGAGTPDPFTKYLGMSLGHLSVLIFFGISGFFIARSYDRSRSFRTFMYARTLRLFPALIIVLLVTIFIACVFTTVSATEYWKATPRYFFGNASLLFPKYDLPGIFLSAPYGPAINGSLWTLLYEVICYTGIALLGITKILTRKNIGITVTSLIVISCIFMPKLHPTLDPIADLGLPFFLGTLLYLNRLHIRLSLSISIIILVVTLPLANLPAFKPLFIIAVCYAVFSIGYSKNNMLQHYNRLGDYSYGFYIYAFPVQQIGATIGYTDPLTNILFATPVTLICAVISWHIIEAPAINLKTKFIKTHT